MTEDKSSGEETRLQAALEFSDAIIATVREPLLVLDNKFRIMIANRSFYRTFHVNPEETEKKLIFDLGNGQWDIPMLRKLLENILPMNKVFEDYEVEHDFESIGRKTMLLNARKIYREMNNVEMILLAIEDITERKKVEEKLKRIASLDGLTGIANRRHFDNTINLEWRRAMRSAKPISLITIVRHSSPIVFGRTENRSTNFSTTPVAQSIAAGRRVRYLPRRRLAARDIANDAWRIRTPRRNSAIVTSPGDTPHVSAISDADHGSSGSV